MQRWHLSAALAGSAALVALFAPTLRPFFGGLVTADPVPLTPEDPTPPALLTPAITPESGPIVALTAGLDHPAVLSGRSEERLMVVTLKAPTVEGDHRRGVNVAVVVDRSGSMNGQNKMQHAQAAARELVAGLQDDDRFALVAFDDRAEVVVPFSPITDRSWLYSAIDSLRPSGSTNLYGGLAEGMQQVASHADAERINRVLVLSDGQATVGITDPNELIKLAGLELDKHVSVSTIGVGVDYNEDLLAAMADRGNGSYRFVGEATDLANIFRAELQQMTSVAARGTWVNVDLQGAELVEVYGYETVSTSEGFKVQVGDLYSGETRKVVARVRVHGGAVGQTAQVATVTLDVDGKPAAGQAGVNAEFTNSMEVTQNKVNRELAILGNQAASSALMDKAARAYAVGDVSTSRQMMAASELVAGEAASRYASDELDVQSQKVREQAESYEKNDPTSEQGRYEVKKAKESSRVGTRGSGIY